MKSFTATADEIEITCRDCGWTSTVHSDSWQIRTIEADVLLGLHDSQFPSHVEGVDRFSRRIAQVLGVFRLLVAGGTVGCPVLAWTVVAFIDIEHFLFARDCGYNAFCDCG